MSKIPPFAPGDRVIRTGESYPAYGMHKGHIYTVDSIIWCCEQMGWRIELVELPADYPWTCHNCKRRTRHEWQAMYFRKVEDISDHTTESLLTELETKKTELVPV